MATAILTGKYVRSTFVEDQREFVEHLQIGKQIGKLLDMPKSPQTQKHIFGSGIWNIWKPGSKFWKIKISKTMFTQHMCIMAVTLFQTSSRGSGLKQNLSWGTNQKHYKHAVIF